MSAAGFHFVLMDSANQAQHLLLNYIKQASSNQDGLTTVDILKFIFQLSLTEPKTVSSALSQVQIGLQDEDGGSRKDYHQGPIQLRAGPNPSLERRQAFFRVAQCEVPSHPANATVPHLLDRERTRHSS